MEKHNTRENKWTYFKDRDELRYAGKSSGEVIAVIDIGDIEIYVNKDGEINEIAIYNASKYIPVEDIGIIADTNDIDKILNTKTSKTTL